MITITQTRKDMEGKTISDFGPPMQFSSERALNRLTKWDLQFGGKIVKPVSPSKIVVEIHHPDEIDTSIFKGNMEEMGPLYLVAKAALKSSKGNKRK